MRISSCRHPGRGVASAGREKGEFQAPCSLLPVLPCGWWGWSERPLCLAPCHNSFPLNSEDSLFSSSGGGDGVRHFKPCPRGSRFNGAKSGRQEGPGRGCSASLLTQPSYTLLSCFALLFLPQISRARRGGGGGTFPDLSKHAGRRREDEKHLGSARAGWLGWGSAAPPTPQSDSFTL